MTPLTATTRKAEPMGIYRWRGVDPKGEQRAGVWSSRACPDLPAEVRTLHERGWRSLVVCAGEGPVPPPACGPDDTVARIAPDPATGKRTWWAEAEPVKTED